MSDAAAERRVPDERVVPMIGSRWLPTVLGTLGCAVALFAAQQLVARAGWRVDLSPERRHVLSPHARQILAALDRPVAVSAFLRADDPRNRDIEDLLGRVAAAQPLVHYRTVDVNRSPALARELGVDAYGAVVVESDGRRRDFANPDEQTLMAAIIQVTKPRRRRVYLSVGHGERRVGDRDRQAGYSAANVALINELYEVGEVELDADTPVPADAAALIVAGPRRDLPAGAVRQIDAYLRRGGGLLALLDPGDAPALAAQLGRYGIVVSDEIVLDPAQRLFAGDYLTMLIPEHPTDHPVSAALGGPPLFSGVRAVRSADGGRGGADILATGPESWRTPDRAVLEHGVAEFVLGRDNHGPVSVGASAEVPAGDGHPGRILVFGDADFASNLLLDYLGNRDLLLNSVNWLAHEESMVGSRPPAQIPGVNQLFISDRQGERVFWIGAVLPPVALLLLGVAVIARRRRS